MVYLNYFKNYLYKIRKFQGDRDVRAMIYPPRTSDFVHGNNRKRVAHVSSVLFKTQGNALNNDDNNSTFKNNFD